MKSTERQLTRLPLLSAFGALAVLGIAVLLMSLMDRAASELRVAERERQQIESLMFEGQMLVDMVHGLNADSPFESIALTQLTVERIQTQVDSLKGQSRFAATADLKRASQSLRLLGESFDLNEDGTVRTAPTEETLEDQRSQAVIHLLTMLELNRNAATIAQSLETNLSFNRRLIFCMVTGLCLLYLLVVELFRRWAMRRYVHPAEQLAKAVREITRGSDFIPHLRDFEARDVRSLSSVLEDFVNRLREKVDERTTDLERQKEQLQREVETRRNAEDQLRYAAFHDRLTGLCNRELLVDRLSRCIQRARRNPDFHFAVLFLDIDRFKVINDSLGHTAGDRLLIEVARRFEQCLRATDTLSRDDSQTIARIGGDEFVLVLEELADASDACLVAKRLQEVLKEPFNVEGQEVFASASIGIALDKPEYETPDQLLRDADAAMYHAKSEGKARHEVFDTSMTEQAMHRLQLGTDLRRAIEGGEFEVFYQPIVSIKTDQIIGFESLVRWQHPERGYISPAEFIWHTEETGMIVELGRQVLNRAVQQMSEWHQQLGTTDLSVSVNVSARQAAEPTLVDDVRAALVKSGLDPTCLKLEITESVIMGNPHRIAEVMAELRSMGCEIHMDDFGTGYSSLSYLHRFPLDVLKIDREFLLSMQQNEDYAGIVQTVIALAHHLGMRVTIEGVETAEQYARLAQMKGDYAQGYYFSKPVPADAAKNLLVGTPTWKRTAA